MDEPVGFTAVSRLINPVAVAQVEHLGVILILGRTHEMPAFKRVSVLSPSICVLSDSADQLRLRSLPENGVAQVSVLHIHSSRG